MWFFNCQIKIKTWSRLLKKSQKPFRKNAPLIANRKCICQNSSFAPTTKIIIFLRKKKIIETLWKLFYDYVLPSDSIDFSSLIPICLFAREQFSFIFSHLRWSLKPNLGCPRRLSRGGETNEWKKLKIRAAEMFNWTRKTSPEAWKIANLYLSKKLF